jgi:RNA 3'-terminal phosphate cyclase (ATP)
MIRIDGSYLEGGGQIVRGAVAFSALAGVPVEIFNIRKNRPNPGLAPQHIAAVRAVAGICAAECTNLVPGSTDLFFSPHDLTGQDLVIDVGTAGSIALVLQAWMPVALAAGGRITVTGGTEVQKSPTIEYFDAVFCETLRRHGAEISVDVHERGYYPRGGGRVTIDVRKTELRPLSPETPSAPVRIFSCSSRLPTHVAQRQAAAAARRLSVSQASCTIDTRDGPSPGSSCTVVAGRKGGIALGRRGYPAEAVGTDAAEAFLEVCAEPGTADRHLADQLVIILASFGGLITTTRPTDHTKTMCRLAAAFGHEISLREKPGRIWEMAA